MKLITLLITTLGTKNQHGTMMIGHMMTIMMTIMPMRPECGTKSGKILLIGFLLMIMSLGLSLRSHLPLVMCL